MTGRAFGLVGVLYLLSGAAALAYQVAWNRMLGATLGTSSLTLATLLAAFMAGLALGSRALEEPAERSVHPLRLYGLMELGIAAWALLVPALVGATSMLHRLLYGLFEGHLAMLLALRLVMCFLVLLVPTTLMGGTFPVLARAAQLARPGAPGRQMALLYALNTAGAIAGAAIAGFVAIERLGVRGTSFVAALVSAAAGGTALLLGRRSRPGLPEPSAPRAAPPPPAGVDQAASRRALALVAASGFAMLALEVVWTRMLATVVTSTTHAFSAMLVVFLLGVATGSALVMRLVARTKDPLVALSWLAAACGVAAVLGLRSLDDLSTPVGVVARSLWGIGSRHYLAYLLSDVAKLALLPTLLSGAMLPVAIETLARGGASPARAAGRVYAVNTVAAMFGAPFAGFLLIPLLGRFAWVVVALGTLLAVAAFAASRAAGAVALALVGALAASTDLASPLGERLGVYGTTAGARVRYYREGASCTVAVVDDPAKERRLLYTDAFEVAGVSLSYRYMRVLGHLPLLLAPGSRRAAVVGLGTGTTAAALASHPIDALDIVEISPDVVAAARELGADDGLLRQPRPGLRLRIVQEDGKAHLAATTARYDVIVSEPPFPGFAGGSSLFAREFYEAVRRALVPGGVFVHWLPPHGASPEQYPGLVQSFVDAFPEGRALLYRRMVFLLAGPDVVDVRRVTEALAAPGTREKLDACGVRRAEDLTSYLILDGPALRDYAKGSRPVTDDDPWVEFARRDPDASRSFLENREENVRALLRHVASPPHVEGIPDGPRQAGQRAAVLALEAMIAQSEASRLEGDARRQAVDRVASLARQALAEEPDDAYAQDLLRWCASPEDDPS